jgi:hypothetical protein
MMVKSLHVRPSLQGRGFKGWVPTSGLNAREKAASAASSRFSRTHPRPLPSREGK